MGLHEDNKCSDLIENGNYKYNENALRDMFDRQIGLQRFLAEKGKSVDPLRDDPLEKIMEAIYNWNSATVEFFELMQRYKNISNKQEDILEIRFEYIDIFHFLMNMLIFTQFFYHDYKLKMFYENAMFNSDLYHNWGRLSYKWGEYIDLFPYKKWKSYSIGISVDQEKVQKIGLEILQIFFNIGRVLEINMETFYNLYMLKNKENIDRQLPGGKYYDPDRRT